jgi:hypothetical protein
MQISAKINAKISSKIGAKIYAGKLDTTHSKVHKSPDTILQ